MLSQLFMHSLVAFYMCPNQRLNAQPWCTGLTILLSYPTVASTFVLLLPPPITCQIPPLSCALASPNGIHPAKTVTSSLKPRGTLTPPLLTSPTLTPFGFICSPRFHRVVTRELAFLLKQSVSRRCRGGVMAASAPTPPWR